MKKSFLKAAILCGTVLALLTGCSGDDPGFNDPAAATTASTEMDATEQQAFDTALAEAIHLINSGENTRALRRIPERSRLRCQPLRPRRATRGEAGHAQGDIYAVSFGDNEGFSIISTVPGRPRVYAFSSTGDFTFDRTRNNDGINSYIDWLESQDEVASRLPNDSLWTPGITRPPLEPWPGQPTLPAILTQVNPILPESTVGNWNPGYPYNLFTPKIGSQQTGTGCAAVACAQAMAAFKWPLQYNGYTFDWDNMLTDVYHTDVARLMQQLGLPCNLNTTYGWDESPADPNNIPRTFINLGYQACCFSDYNFENNLTSLKSSRPIIVIGYRNNKGHAWVIDGLKRYKMNDLGSQEGDSESTYYHCLWGWGTGSSGWYLFSTEDNSGTGIFDPTGSPYTTIYTYLNMKWMTNIRK